MNQGDYAAQRELLQSQIRFQTYEIGEVRRMAAYYAKRVEESVSKQRGLIAEYRQLRRKWRAQLRAE